MINAFDFINHLKENGYLSYFGVPDSILSSFSKSLYFDFNNLEHTITANEGNALAMSIGYQVTNNQTPVIYLQNSGLGNLVNPYLSLTNKYVYDIPALYLIGWRGEPGTSDEPQHIFQGKITPALLDLLEIDFDILDSDSDYKKIIEKANRLNMENKSFAILVKKNTFIHDKRVFPSLNSNISRQQAIEHLLDIEQRKNIYVSSTGMLSRELDAIRNEKDLTNSDFYLIGGMGHTFSVAYSLALQNTEKTIFCLDGDGSFLMHLGSVGLMAQKPLNNYFHILFSNGSHQSVGGQPNYINEIDLKTLAISLGFKSFVDIKNIEDLNNNIYDLQKPAFINIIINNDFNPNLGRPRNTPVENKEKLKKRLYE